MKNNRPDAELLWKQLDDVLVPRLGLTLAERVVYHHLVGHCHLEGKRQLRFSIPCFARSLRLSDATTRQAVRSLAVKGALRLIDRTMAGHLTRFKTRRAKSLCPSASAGGPAPTTSRRWTSCR